ncbi:helix-turn-helix domain-containing protein [Mucilaginibacter sp. SG564]|uniref:winged helix-turn-helix transcriptional regulator n=2 Tax=unclassified Mucilaginibacter TaxID=2617802 RepID=UPI0020A65BC9|nr:helix-turn-helix domain-containing protein [Mucilaginibacter sp. SG564]
MSIAVLFMEGQLKKRDHSSTECKAAASSIRDALYVLNGKWKLPLIVTLVDGPLRFNDIQRALSGITPKILSKELKELELNEFVKRNIFSTTPVTVTYEATPYSQTLGPVLEELQKWGKQHRERIIASRRETPVLEVDNVNTNE